MRNLIFILVIISSFATQAEDFTVFEKDGYFGLKDETGNVTVPAVYEKLGWSNGTTTVCNGVIGFKQDNLWGLITVRNKALTGQKFYAIEPISTNYFKASIKGRFSNHLFHGILDEKGKTIISFNYFTIEPLGAHWLVSAFDGKRQKFGVVSFQNLLMIPTNYAAIKAERKLFIGEQLGKKLDLYSTSGSLLQLDLDSVNYENGWIAFRDGYAGFLTDSGEEIYSFEYKNFEHKEDEVLPILFPEWTIYQSDTVLLKWRSDSLSVSENDLLIAYLNGAHHLLLKNNTLLNNHELTIKEVVDDQLIVQNSKSRKWSILSEEGNIVISDYDSIHSVGDHYGCYNSKGWFLIDKKGRPKNRLPLQDLDVGINRQFIAKRNNHWGIIKPGANGAVTFKYDSIVTSNAEYFVSYLNRWGVLNENEEWVVRSEFNEVLAIGSLLIGRKGKGYTIFYDGSPMYKTIAKPLSKVGRYILMEGDSAKLGLINAFGEVVIRPDFDEIINWSNYTELSKQGQIVLLNTEGQTILRFDENYQQVGGYGEGYFAVKKEDRWGFVDSQGRLRISNRYDGARPFQDGLAAVMLRGKWGFIDKSENIQIQPYYTDATQFQNGRSIVQLNKKFGLMDENGKEVLELIWKSIRRLNTGNYIVQDTDDRIGLVNEDGSFIFRPSFDHLNDFGDRVLVSKNGAWGILNYDKHPIFKINHEEIKVIGNFTMIKD